MRRGKVLVCSAVCLLLLLSTATPLSLRDKVFGLGADTLQPEVTKDDVNSELQPEDKEGEGGQEGIPGATSEQAQAQGEESAGAEKQPSTCVHRVNKEGRNECDQEVNLTTKIDFDPRGLLNGMAKELAKALAKANQQQQMPKPVEDSEESSEDSEGWGPPHPSSSSLDS